MKFLPWFEDYAWVDPETYVGYRDTVDEDGNRYLHPIGLPYRQELKASIDKSE